MPSLNKLIRVLEQLSVDELDQVREYIEWRRQELLNAQSEIEVPEEALGIDAVCAAIKRNRSDMTNEQLTEIKWTTNMLYLKEESKGYFE
jgi:hypothetical protein